MINPLVQGFSLIRFLFDLMPPFMSAFYIFIVALALLTVLIRLIRR